jgi:membrane fusion protein (multidrug efflux system)
MSRTVTRFLLLIVVPALAVVGAVAFWLQGGRYVTTQNAYVKSDIAHVASEMDGRIAHVLVRDHAHVKAGDELIHLDRRPFEVALAKAEAEVDVARQQIKTLIASWHEAQSELAEANGKFEFLEMQLDRQKKLAKRGIVASTRLEEAEEALRAAKDKAAVARQRVQSRLSALGGDPKRPIDLHPVVREKLAARDAAALDLDRTVIKAPIDGQVANLRLQPGEQIESAKALMAIVSANTPWVEANFKETELTHVRSGMEATVILDIYPDQTWRAKVDTISPATGAEFALLPPQNASGNWVKVVQRLPVRFRLVGSDGEAPPLRAGMTATVSVDTERQRTLAQIWEPLMSWTGSAMAKSDAAAPSNTQPFSAARAK